MWSRLCNLQEVTILVHRLLLRDTRWEHESEIFDRDTLLLYDSPTTPRKQAADQINLMLFVADWISFYDEFKSMA